MFKVRFTSTYIKSRGIIYLSTVLSCVSNIRLQQVLSKRDYNNDEQRINSITQIMSVQIT